MRMAEPLASAASQGAVVTKAVLRAAERLAVSAATLAAIIGLSPASLTRMKKGEFTLEAGTKPFELAILFVRLFRSLDAIAGGDERIARAWLTNPNTALDATPLDKIRTIPGLMDVIAYLDARRALL
ncbi:antitoxin Xre/MbcA/ParS toxin-binding domain-containing protein [Xanthobacter sp. KR7-65]|uniref:antitoxin Xre/MbcA/ParS toxin-binding domain-containing protein n=1 Tax=Xanthobacter sp. KR7-65 TaxID=3156612 RepID=UPI0032B36D29